MTPRRKVAYFYVSGAAMYIGLKIVSGSPYSFHVLDYGVYSPSDPSSDAADDSTRYKMTALPGFDNSLTVGANGSIYNLNAGLATIAHGDSSTFSVAYVGGPTLAAMQAAADSADVRYQEGVHVDPADIACRSPEHLRSFRTIRILSTRRP
jgi:hypothetical protein